MLKKFCSPVLAVFSLALLCLINTPRTALASTQDFVINDFKVQYVLTNQDNQGQLQVTESIDLTYSDVNHGIYRAIPKSYKGHSLLININEITSTTNAPVTYSSSTSNGNLVLKIGDVSKTVTGPQNYVIKYTVKNVIGFYNDHDELYWDVNGDQWNQVFNHVSAVLSLPSGVVLISQKPVCYTGAYGSSVSNCLIAATIDSSGTLQVINAETTQPLQAG